MSREALPIVLVTVRARAATDVATAAAARVPAEEHRAVRISRTARGGVVVEDDPGSPLRREARAEDMADAGRLLADGPLADPAARLVALALDEPAQAALWHAVRERPDVLATATPETAERAVAALASGRTPAEILAPVPFSTAGVLAGPTGEGTEGPVRLAPEAHGDGAWLRVAADHLEVALDAVDPETRPQVEHLARSRRPGRPPGSGGRHLLIGPANAAGQGHAWARAVTEHLQPWTAEALHVFGTGTRLSFASAAPTTIPEWHSPAARLNLALDLVLPASHVLIESARPLLATSVGSGTPDPWDGAAARADVAALRRGGRSVAALFHGSEVREPALHAELEPWSPFRDPSLRDLTERLTSRVSDVRRATEADGLVVFVSTPDLMEYVPGAHWLPVVVGPDAFIPGPPALRRGRPVVGHAPTHSAFKGSEWVDPVLTALDEEGVIVYRRFASLPPFGVTRALRTIDVLVDQVVLGNPGVLATQAMAGGRLVLAHLPEYVRRRFPEPPPVVEVTPESLERTVRSIARAPEAYAGLADAGPGFARRQHDGRRSAQVLHEVFLR